MSKAKWISRFHRDNSGAQAVEFAIIAPLLFATLFGAFEVGRMMYERNLLSAAAAEGSRAVALYGAADTTNITNAIKSKLSKLDQNELAVVLTDETFGTATFKKIEITYNFDFLIKFSKDWNGMTITATRYAPSVT